MDLMCRFSKPNYLAFIFVFLTEYFIQILKLKLWQYFSLNCHLKFAKKHFKFIVINIKAQIFWLL